MANKKPLILVTNDDGITAPGIRALISVMKDIGNVVVVAPDSPQSGKGHAITIDNTLFSTKLNVNKKKDVLRGVLFFRKPNRANRCNSKHSPKTASNL